MSLRTLPALALFAAGCHVRPESLVPAGVGAQGAPRSEFLQAAPETFVVLGDEISFVWPTMLQDLLDAHARPGFHRVQNGAVPEGGIGAWTSQEESAPLQALVRKFPARREGARVPRTALCVISLRGLGDARGPVKSENDMVGAEMGADALERVAKQLRQAGVERVVFATPLFRPGSEPEVGLERIAIERLLARGHAYISAGPDLFGASRPYFPDAFEQDRLHPNEFGLKLVAEEWYRWLAGPEAKEAVVEALYARDYDVAALEAGFAESHEFARP